MLATSLAVLGAPAVADEPEPVGPLDTWAFNADDDDLGRATSGDYQVGFNAVARDHQNGRLYATPAGVHPVAGAMFTALVAQGGHGRLGYPVGDVETTTQGALRQEFQLGVLFHSRLGSSSVVFPLYDVFAGRGGADVVGLPVGPEQVQGSRLVQKFEHTTLSVSRDAGQDSLGLRRGSLYYFKNDISPGEAHDVVAYGRPGDTVLVGDWDGDGVDTLAVRRGNEYHVKNSIASGVADKVIAYGRPGDTVMVGDWDGDGVDTLAVRRGNEYHIKNSISSGVADRVVGYGRAGDEAIPGDWFGTGTDTIAVRRGATFYFKRTLVEGVADSVIHYGRPGDAVVVGDWDGDGTDSLAVRRGSEYHVNNDLRGGSADLVAVYGRPADVVLAGDWDGRRRDYSRTSGTPTPVQPVAGAAELSRLSTGWANNSVNTTAFRKSSLASTTAADGTVTQYTAYYDPKGSLVLARRDRGADRWQYEWTQYAGNVTDAHNSISITVDGEGYLHVTWGHHGSPLSYARSVAPGSLELGPKTSMVGTLESRVTYPEFFGLPDGDLFFLYRNGGSGNGTVVLNRYDAGTARWSRVHDNLIDGEGARSAYWQAVVDSRGRLHVSWVWRQSPDVATNHDMAYARSTDSTGRTWETSEGGAARLPITRGSAEYAVRVPQGSDLMNQTSMTTDAADEPYIASYWRSDSGATQYQVVHQTAAGWSTMDTGIRTTGFSLSGGGTKALPIARPQILVSGAGAAARLHLVIRDVERGGRASLATLDGRSSGAWRITDLTKTSLGEWEPSYDLDLWRSHAELDVFVQNVTQVDGEGLEEYPPQYVNVMSVDDGLVGR